MTGRIYVHCCTHTYEYLRTCVRICHEKWYTKPALAKGQLPLGWMPSVFYFLPLSPFVLCRRQWAFCCWPVGLSFAPFSSIISFNIVHFSCVIVRRCQMTTPPPSALPSLSVFNFSFQPNCWLSSSFVVFAVLFLAADQFTGYREHKLVEGRVGIGYIDICIYIYKVLLGTYLHTQRSAALSYKVWGIKVA